MQQKLGFVIAGSKWEPTGSAQWRRLAFANGQEVLVPQLSDALLDKLAVRPQNLLADLSLNEIIAFLANVGKNWKSQEYSRRKLYIMYLQKFLGYSQKAAEHEANWIAMLLCSHYRMFDTVAAELGSRHILDQWCLREEAEVRAFPKGTVFHHLAGNVPLSGVASILRGIITKNDSLIKSSSDDPITPLYLALSFMDVDSRHPVTRSMSVLTWDGEAGGSHAQQIIKMADCVCVWGGDSAIAWASTHAKPQADVLQFGPKRSMALVGKDADMADAAQRLAHDISIYDQKACFSIQQVFCAGDADVLISHLQAEMARYARLVPKGQTDFDEQANWSLTTLESVFLGCDTRQSPDCQHWAIVPCAPVAIDSHPLGRTIFVHQVADLREALEFVDTTVQTVAASPWSELRALRDAFAKKGASRFVDLGLNNVFRVGGAHDGMFPLQRLVRYASTEFDSLYHVKGITMKVDQTRFLEDDIFLELVP